MKRLIKNRFIFLAIIVIFVSVAYFGIQKLIDDYAFKNNSDIVSEEEISNSGLDGTQESEGAENLNEVGDRANAESSTIEKSEDLSDDLEQFSDEETNLVLEEIEAGSGVIDENEVLNKKNDTVVESKIFIYITGEVNNPGVVILNDGSRIVDAINAAGGTTSKADISKVNLVFVLNDGMKVNIPNSNDLKNNSNFEYITMSSGDGEMMSYNGSDVSESSSSSNSSSYGTGGSKKYDVVNINTATQTELETLPGIGPSLALKIINYRKENGKFSSIDQIKNVSGIGDSKFAELKGYISI